MPNDASSKPVEELGEEELEQVAGGAGGAFGGEYVIEGATHSATEAKRVSKVEQLTIKPKVTE